MNIGDCLRINARNHPNKVALEDGKRRLTYEAFNRRVNQLANGLISLNIKRGTIVSVILPSGQEHLESLFALGKIGAIALPIDDRWESGEIERTIKHFEAAAVILSKDKLGTFLEIEKKVDRIAGNLICTQETANFGASSYEELIQRSSPIEPECPIDEHDTFLIALSSGTTGIPKGAVITHRNMIFRFLTQIVEFGFNSSDIFLNVTPMHHGGGRSHCMCHLFVGGKVYILGGRFDPERTVEIIPAERITTCFMVPTMYHRILEIGNLNRFDTKSLRVLFSSGAPLHSSIRQGIIEHMTPYYYDYYASVDGGGISLLKPQDMLRRGDSVGQGVFNTEIRIVDEKGHEVRPGVVGEVMYKGPGTAKKYYKNPKATRECFSNGWFLPGDLARMDEEGFLYIVGRKKDMIIRGGVNIYPPEIEETLQSHPGIYEAAVIGIPNQDYGEEIAAFVVAKGNQAVSREDVVQFCKQHLAAYKRPKLVQFVPFLPRASSGKIIKGELKEKYLDGKEK